MAQYGFNEDDEGFITQDDQSSDRAEGSLGKEEPFLM